MKRIYVLENENGLVKIGVSKTVESRVNTLSKQGGFTVKNLYFTELCSNHFNIERIIHVNLSECRRNGEWFEVKFEDAVSIVDKYFELYAKFGKVEKDYSAMADRFFDRVSQLK